MVLRRNTKKGTDKTVAVANAECGHSHSPPIIKHGLHVCIPGPRYPRAAASLMIIIWFVCQHSATSPPPRTGDRDRGNFELSQSAVSHLMDLGNMNFQNLFLENILKDNSMTQNIKFDIFNKTESK